MICSVARLIDDRPVVKYYVTSDNQPIFKVRSEEEIMVKSRWSFSLTVSQRSLGD